MCTVLSVPSSSAPEPDITPTPQMPIRRHGEFIMAGSLTPTAEPVTETPDSPANVMPYYTHREEVQTMLKKLRDSVSLWERIPNAPPQTARDSVARLVLPQHTMYVK